MVVTGFHVFGRWHVATAALLLACAGCQPAFQTWLQPVEALPPATPDPSPAAVFPFESFQPRETAETPELTRKIPQRVLVDLHVLHVRVPRNEPAAEAVWAYLREDLLSADAILRLQRNGVRCGVGRNRRWEAIRAVLNEISDTRVHHPPPVRSAPGIPTALELDLRPADHDVFYMDANGILRGETWRASRKVLRVTVTLDTRKPDHVFLSVVPEIRRELPAKLAYDQQAGWSDMPRREGTAYAAAAFVQELGPDQFLAIAPGTKADLFGIVGGAFLTHTAADEAYDSYVFLRPEITYVR